MPSSISVLSRRVGLVDLGVRQRTGVTGYRFLAASNFDGVFTVFQTVGVGGFRSPSAQTFNAPIGSQFRGWTRFVFSPLDYAATFPAVRDDVPFYVRIQPVLAGGVFGPVEAMQIVLPYSTVPNRAVLLRGTATAAGPTASMEINLPGLCTDFNIRNGSSGTRLFVGFDRATSTGFAGPEYMVAPGASLEMDYPQASRVFIRGESGSAEIYAVLTQKTQPLNL